MSDAPAEPVPLGSDPSRHASTPAGPEGGPVTDRDELAARAQTVLRIPLHRFLGVRLIDPDDPPAGITFPAAEAALNNVGVLHGGVVTALLDVASYLALLPSLAAGEHAVTHDLAVSLMRPVAAHARVHVRGELVRKGRAVAFLRAEATVDGRPVASAQVTKTVLAAR